MGFNLFTALFYLLLFSLMCGTLLCGHVSANKVEEASETAKTVELITEKLITKALKPDGSSETENVHVNDYYAPVFLSTTNDVFVALAGVNRTGTDKNITVLTRYIDIQSDTDWREKLFTSPISEWKTQLAAYDNCKQGCKGDSVVRGFVTAAAKGNKIYLFSVNATTTNSAGSDPVLTFWLAVSNFDISSNGGKIMWDMKEKEIIFSEGQPKPTGLIKGQELNKIAFSGSALVKEEKVIFLLRIQTSDKKTVFAFLNLEDTRSSEKNAKFLHFGEVGQGCYPQFFPWKEKIIMVSTKCEGGASNQMVKETTDFTTMKDWTDSSEPFLRFVDFFHDKSDFTTANIRKNTNNSEVLLFIQKKKKEEQSGNNDVYLWVTDGSRVYCAKEAFTDVSDAPISLLYTNDELLTLYKKWETNGPKEIVLMRLKTQLDDITIVINAWKNTDGIVQKVCSGKILCEAELSTNGLVGFLSDNSEDTNKIWKDEYYYVNATVNDKATKVSSGFTFSGDGAGAKWPVGKEQKDQPYNFTDPGFTLLATVEIGKNNNEKTFDNSLLGLILKENDKHIGLLCSGGNWAVGDNNNFMKKSGEKCEQEETYVVGLVLKKGGNLAIYVDGSKLTDLDDPKLKIEEGKNITHFYFGADAEGASGTQKLAKTDVTVTNVLLYNRPFDEEIKKFKAKKREKPKPLPPPINGTINTQENGKSTSETDRTSSTSATEKDGAEINLCFFFVSSVTLFSGVFTLLGRYVY